MNILSGEFVNCYGIKRLHFDFDFTPIDKHGNVMAKAYAIYVPNGVMKSSFAKTFLKISKGEEPEEQRYHRKPRWNIDADKKPIKPDMIYVLDSSADVSSASDSDAVTNILVDPQSKARYDSLIIELEEKKKGLLKNLNQYSGVTKNGIEKLMLEDFKESNFAECIEKNVSKKLEADFSLFKYATIFNDDTNAIINSQEFLENAKNYNDRYQELFIREDTIFKKGIFNPDKAKETLDSLTKNGFFDADHKVHFFGDKDPIDGDNFKTRYNSCMKAIDADEKLKELRAKLARTVKTRSLFEFVETLDYSTVAFLMDNLASVKRPEFKRNLWIFYLQNSAYTNDYLKKYYETKDEISNIEIEAAALSNRWTEAVDLFNNRFVDMPCKLDVNNRAEAVLGKEKAVLVFKFEDEESKADMQQKDLKTLSTGEMRALYLLNMIFEAEYRKINRIETLFIFDDIVDSFDYKNKAAILLYLDDLAKVDCFHQIILTHNFDFYRALTLSFVHRDRCLTSVLNTDNKSIKLEPAEGIKNCFIGVLKPQIKNSDKALCATIPFTRNLIEYTKGNETDSYKTLTKLLHWKKDSESITVKDYLNIYHDVIGDTITRTDSSQPVIKIIFSEADKICKISERKGLNLTDKILLCMAIRIRAERFMIDKLQEEHPGYWCEDANQYGHLLTKVKSSGLSHEKIRLLDKVSITVNSNIHLNSFMYEPIVDLNLESLIYLYHKVNDLKNLD